MHALEAMARAKGVTAGAARARVAAGAGRRTSCRSRARASTARLEENVAATELALTPQELAQLDGIVPQEAVAGMRYTEAGMRSVQR